MLHQPPRSRHWPSSDYSLSIVVIPGYATLAPEQWKTPSESWLDLLANADGSRASLQTYQYSRPLTDSPCLEQLYEEAYTLLDVLSENCKSKELKQRPIFFICHSLGGIVLKKALCTARDKLTEYLDLLNLVSGIAFLSTPHIQQSVTNDTSLVETIIRTNPEFSNLRKAWTMSDNASLRKLSLAFEQLKVQVPIISAYETQETQVYRGQRVWAKLRSQKTVMVVGNHLSKINSENERHLAIPADHCDICVIRSDSKAFAVFQSVIAEIGQKAPNDIAERLRRFPTDVGAASLKSYSTFRPHLAFPNTSADNITSSSDTQGLTAQATQGSSNPAADFEILPLPVFEIVRRNPKLPRFSVPLPRNRYFSGRQDVLDAIAAHLLPSSVVDTASLQSFTLSGMPGIGKTSTALEFAYRYQHDYDAIFWLHADDENILAKEFADIAIELELSTPEAQSDLQALRDIVNGWLSIPYRTLDDQAPDKSEANWLLIFDNVDKLSVLSEYWPELSQGAVLVTSRDPLAKEDFRANSIGIDLDGFSLNESVALFRNLAGRETTDQEDSLRQFAEKMGGLPLAISTLAGMKTSLRLSYTRLTGLYNSMKGLDATLASQLGLQSLAPSPRSLIQLMSMLDPDEIPEQIIRSGFVSGVIEPFPKTELEYFVARADLLKSSLITYNEQDEVIGLHRIVRDVARSLMTATESVEFLRIALQLLSKSWTFQDLRNRFDKARWAKCEKVFPSVVRVRMACEEIIANTPSYQPDDSVAALFNDAGWYWFERGFPQESKVYFELTQTICEKSPNKHTENIKYILRESHNNRSSACAETNDRVECLKHAKIWLQMVEARVSSDGQPLVDYELGGVYNETGVAFAMNEQFETAVEYFLKSIETFQSLENYDDTMLGWPEPNLGFMYWLMGKYEESEKVLLEILDIYAVAFGPDDTRSFKTGKILYALGNLYYSMGDMERSYNFHSRCLKQYYASLGPGHHRTGDVCHRLASHYMRSGDLKTARLVIEQAIKIFSSRSYYGHELARSKYKEGQVFVASQDSTAANASFEMAYSLRKAICPSDKRSIQELSEKDFDDLVIFWSR